MDDPTDAMIAVGMPWLINWKHMRTSDQRSALASAYKDMAALARPKAGGVEAGWLPIVLCPTDGVDRMLRLPDGTDVVGAHHSNPGRWETKKPVEFDVPVFEEPLRGGFIAKDNQPARPEAPRKQIGTRKSVTMLVGRLPDGVYPTHFRPNDTVYGSARAALTPSEGQTNG